MTTLAGARFEQFRGEYVRGAGGGQVPIVGVEHVGSTAVASLAKPVINCGIVAAERYVLMDHR